MAPTGTLNYVIMSPRQTSLPENKASDLMMRPQKYEINLFYLCFFCIKPDSLVMALTYLFVLPL